MYQLESGSGSAQRRYEALIYALNSAPEGSDWRRKRALPADQIVRRDNSTAIESQIMGMFDGNAPLSAATIHERLRFLGYSRPAIQKSMKRLRATGLILVHEKKYRMMSGDQDTPLDIGVPIMFLPGMRSQEPGVIIDKKELKHSGGGIHPIARLRSGRMVFVNSDMAKADISQLNCEEHEQWLINLIESAGAKGLGRNEISRKAYEAKIPKVSELLIRLEKSKQIKGRLQMIQGEKMKAFWLAKYFPEIKSKVK
jgi:biotin operon repressor